MRMRDTILDAASQEIMRHGYAASSLSAIAARLELTKGALARQFPTKEDLAWGIVDALRDLVEAERDKALEVYPASGLRALVRFLTALGANAAREPRFGAAVVLFTDRSSPTFEVGDLLRVWKDALRTFLLRAEGEGELEGPGALAELVDYVFITNIGDAIFHTHAETPVHDLQSTRLLRYTLLAIGAADPDRIIEDAVVSQT